MSENQNSERVLLDSELDHNHESRLPEESNGYVHSESSQSEDPVEHDADSNDDVESINQVGENGTVLGGEDGSGKEDMFEDCPDELLNSDNREAVAVTETEEFSVEKDGVEDSGAQEMDNGAKDGYAWHEFKEEREVFVRGVSNLRGELKVLINQHLLIGENEGELVDRLNEEEIGEEEGIGEVGNDADAPLSEMIKECSRFIKTAVEERLQNEATIRELHAVLFMKDQEIEGLNSRVTEFSVSSEKDREIEVVANRMLASLGLVGYQEELLDDSVSGKIGQVEKGTRMLIGKYNQIGYEIDQLRQCLSGAGVDVMGQEEYETICVAARDGLLELKRNEVNLVEKVRHLEDENRKLLEQLDKDKKMVDTVNAELGKTKMELEQEKTRCANTREKLTMAVTKGKALVQQRDSLKHSLAEKSSELEKCLIELQEMSSALEVAELCKGELVRSENLVASLQETISQRNAIFEKVEEILSQTSVPEELQSVDIIERFRWLVNERNELKDVSLEFHKLKDSFSSINLPETVSSLDLESQVGWLRESFFQAKDEINTLQDENARTKEAAHNEIDRLSASLSAEFQEKDYLQTELADLMSKYKVIVEKEHQVSLEKDQILKMLIEVSGIEMDDEEGVYESFSDNPSLIFRCFEKIKEQSSASFDSSHVDAELFERVQSLLYVRDQELMLSEKLLEEEMLVRSQVDKLLNDLKLVSEELVVLKEEKGSLQKDLERSEEKSALLREKLSIAVKKGKALVQDRENLKSLLEEKNSEVEKLKLELQQQESAVADCRDQINRLSIDVERIPTLEADLIAIKDQRNQFEQFLLESNNMLQRAVESIDGIVLPVDSVFEDPVGKVKWLAGYVSECQDGKTHAEQELGKVKEEASTLASKLAAAHEIMKSLEDALAVAETNISRLAEEKSEIEVGKTNVELELEKAIEEACSQTSKFAEACATRKSLEEALSLAENNISILFKEKEEVQVSRAAAETEREKVKEEIAIQTGKLEEAYKTIKSLEDALSQVETNVALLTEQNNDAQIGRTNLEDEIKKLQEEAGSHANKLADAYATIKLLEDALLREENNISVLEGEKKNTEEAYKTIKSLEDALSQVKTDVALLTEQNNDAQIGRTNLEDEIKKLQEEAGSQANKLADAYATIKSLEDALLRAENNISILEGEKKNTEEEVLSLNLKLNACMEELAGTSGSLASRSVELTGHLTDLQMLMKDKTLLSKVKGCFETKFESLKNMDLILKNITDCFVNMGFEELKGHHVIEDDLHITKPSSDSLEDIVNIEIDNGWVSAADADNISSHFRKTVEGFQLRNNILTDKFEGFSSFIDEFIAALLRKLQATENGVIVIFDHFESLKQRAKNLEVYKQEQETTIATLKNDVTDLLSACANATRELQFEVGNNLLELSYVPDHEKLNHNLFHEMVESGGDATAEQHERLDGTKYVEAMEKLLFATRKVQNLIKQFESTSNVAAATIEDLQSNLKESRTTFEKAVEERDLNQNRVFELETDVEALQNSCSELKLKLEDYQNKEDKLKEREAEVSSLYNTLLMKEQEAEDSLLSASQVKALFDKIRGIEIPMAELEVGGLEPHNSVYIRKLFHIIDNVTELQHQVDFLSHDTEDLQLTLATKILEIEHLKEDIEKHIKDKQDLEKMNELSELMLEKIIAMLEGSDLVGDQKSAGVKGLLSVLEKQVITLLLDSENSKSKAQELGIKLLGSQKVVDELSIKVKLLEGRTAQPEIVQERNISEAPSPLGSEISEIEDAGSLGQGTISAVPPAAQVRTLRKGSTDHLAINIDVESESLINNEGTDEDKGHVFKSLNTSGLIPKQGKLIADRIDGIWVSGGRVLMSRPQARLGLIAYWLVLHIWLLGTIL